MTRDDCQHTRVQDGRRNTWTRNVRPVRDEERSPPRALAREAGSISVSSRTAATSQEDPYGRAEEGLEHAGLTEVSAGCLAAGLAELAGGSSTSPATMSSAGTENILFLEWLHIPAWFGSQFIIAIWLFTNTPLFGSRFDYLQIPP